jgi:hypothetical protein
LLEHALHYAGGESVQIEVAPGRVEIRPWCVSTSDALGSGQRRSDERVGLTLLARLCLRLGWELEPADTDVLLIMFSRDASAQQSS